MLTECICAELGAWSDTNVADGNRSTRFLTTDIHGRNYRQLHQICSGNYRYQMVTGVQGSALETPSDRRVLPFCNVDAGSECDFFYNSYEYGDVRRLAFVMH